MSDIAVDAAPARPVLTEDVLALIVGLVVFALALVSATGVDLLGWVVATSVWTDASKALAPLSKAYAGLGGPGALVATYVALTAVLTAGAWALGASVARFALAFTFVFFIAYASWFFGSWANFAVVTPADAAKFGVSWSLKLTNEGGFIIALIVGIVIANFFPRFADWLKEAIRPELYIKIAIVIVNCLRFRWGRGGSAARSRRDRY